MKSLKLLAEKYDQVQLTRSEEALVAAQTPEQLLETFQELSQISGDVIVAFEHAITNRSNLIKENTAEQDSDVRVAVLAMEKVLSHLDNSNDKQFCIAFESFARNASLEEGDLDVLTEGKPGFFSKLGKGIKKYAGKAATAVGKGVGAVAKGAGQVAGGLAGGVVGAGKALAQGAKQGYNVAKDVVAGTAPAKTGTAPAKAGTVPDGSVVQNGFTNNTPMTKKAGKWYNAQGQQVTDEVAADLEKQASNQSPAVTPATAAPATAAPATAAPVTAAPATANTKPARIGAPAARQAVDAAVKTVASMRSDRRDGVIDYAIQKLTPLKKGATAPAGQVATPTNTGPIQKAPARTAAAESLVAESVEAFYITTNKHFRK
jgi:hypothetical protein